MSDVEARWADLESVGLVQLTWEADEYATIEDLEGDCFNPQANPDMDPAQLAEERREFIRTVEREGVWGLCGEYRLSEEDDWQHADSVWGLVGDDDFYVPDIKAATLDAFDKARAAAAEAERVEAEERETLRMVARELLDANRGGHKMTERAAQWAERILAEGSES